MATKQKTNKAAYLAWFIITMFFCYQYILRASPNVMAEVLRATFLLKAEQFATLGALYLLAYSVLQIPLGIAVDRLGVKTVLLFSIALCIFGAMLFGNAEHFYMAQIARVMIGAGSASAFMCALKTIADSFPPGKRGLLTGMTLTFGTVGALIAGKLVLKLMEHFTWRDISNGTAILGVLLLVVSFWVLKPQRKEYNVEASWSQIITTILSIFKHQHIMLYAFLAVGLYTPLSAMADLWGAAFLSKKFGMSHADAAEASLMMYLGLATGSLLLPWLCERSHNLERGIAVCTFGITALFAMLLYGGEYSATTVTWLLLLLGFLCGAEMMCFTGALFYTKKHNSGEIIGVVNTLNMLGGAILQQLVGMILDWQWTGAVDAMGIRQYNPEQFVNAMSIIMILLALCCVSASWLLYGNHGRR